MLHVALPLVKSTGSFGIIQDYIILVTQVSKVAELSHEIEECLQIFDSSVARKLWPAEPEAICQHTTLILNKSALLV